MDEDEIANDITDDIEVVYLDEEEELDDVRNININEIEPGDQNDEEITEEIIDRSKLTFPRHTTSVFSGDLSSNGLFAVTGGEDDVAYVWSTETAEVYLECTGHKDSVTEVAFSQDNQYVATGDMSGLIQIWSMKETKLIWCYEGDDLEWMKWHQQTNILFAGYRSGDIFIWQIPQGNCKVLPSHGCPCLCGKILSDGKRLVAGYRDGQVKLWDIKLSSVIWQLEKTLPLGVNSLDTSNDDSLLIVAPDAQIIKLVDGKFAEVLLDGDEKDIESVLFNNNLGIIVTGSLSGQLCVWDIGKKSLRHQAKIDSSVTVLKWGENGKVFVGATDGVVYVCDAKTGTLVDTLTGHWADVLSITVSADGRSILTTSDDGSAKIFAV